MKNEFTAPWATCLKWISAIGSMVLVIVTGLTFRTQSVAWVSLLPVLILASTVPFAIRGYELEGDTLLVRRLGWNSRVDLRGLKSVELAGRDVFKGTIRLCGNGGLFCFAGWYRNKQLGTFRMIATALDRPVILRWEKRTIVVSPGDPEAFARQLRNRYPHTA